MKNKYRYKCIHFIALIYFFLYICSNGFNQNLSIITEINSNLAVENDYFTYGVVNCSSPMIGLKIENHQILIGPKLRHEFNLYRGYQYQELGVKFRYQYIIRQFEHFGHYTLVNLEYLSHPPRLYPCEEYCNRPIWCYNLDVTVGYGIQIKLGKSFYINHDISYVIGPIWSKYESSNIIVRVKPTIHVKLGLQWHFRQIQKR